MLDGHHDVIYIRRSEQGHQLIKTVPTCCTNLEICQQCVEVYVFMFEPIEDLEPIENIPESKTRNNPRIIHNLRYCFSDFVMKKKAPTCDRAF